MPRSQSMQLHQLSLTETVNEYIQTSTTDSTDSQPKSTQISVSISQNGQARSTYLSSESSERISQSSGFPRTASQLNNAVTLVDYDPHSKRQRISRLPGGTLYPELQWISLHPVRDFISSMLLRNL